MMEVMEVVRNDATRYQDLVVIYEGPPSPSSHTTNSNNNRQIFCLSLPLPPSSTGHVIIHDNDTIILLSSSSIALQLGWPESFLCITSPSSSHLNQDYESKPNNNSNSNSNSNNNILHVKLHPRLTCIRGGKGGFGTLLRGQSKQAGARTTVDFGACRDLSGRRLRHVNDEIKLRKWRELQAAAAKARHRGIDNEEGEGGDDTTTTNNKNASMTEIELAAIRTPSGIRNWHLSIPSWSEVSSQSNKGRRKVERQLVNEVYGWSKKEEYARSIKEEKKLEQERAIVDYVRRGEIEAVAATGGSGGGGNSSVKEGILLAHYKKRKEGQQPHQKKIGGTNNDINDAAVTTAVAENDGTTITNSNNEQTSSSNPFNQYTTTSTTSILSSANYLMTLSGEMLAYVTNEITSKNLIVRLQSQSDFATVVILIDTKKMSNRTSMGMYIEYTLHTAGIAQIGWISSPSPTTNNSGIENNVDDTLSSMTKMFQPNSDTGDGVGDDNASYGYDGSRGLRFHNGKEYVYGSHSGGGSDALTTIVEWKVGDVLGCYCKHQQQVVVSECIYELGYTLNGTDLGSAFTVNSRSAEVFDYYPAISLNMNEIVDVNIGPDFVYYDPKSNCVGMYEVVVVTTNNDADNDDDDDSYNNKTGVSDKSSINDEERNNSNLTKKRARDEVSMEHAPSAEKMSIVVTKGGSVDQPKKDYYVSSVVSFDLNKCFSVDEVKALGSERLKDIMLSMGVKCGGTLEERADRLFSLKGLQRNEYPTKVKGKNFILG